MVSILPAIKNSILNLAFPQRCHSCGNAVTDLQLGVVCRDCWESTCLIGEDSPICTKCGAPDFSKTVTSECQNCREHHYDLARSIGIYEHGLSATILRLKRVPSLPKFLTATIPLVVQAAEFADCDLIVPVPLSSKRQIERGFNQAEVIAKVVSQAMEGRPVDSISLIRTKHTPMHRAAMDRKARESTVHNAFEVKRPKLIQGRSIMLVDDIFTSGATASNCARALKRKGAARVKVFTLARVEGGRTYGRS